MKTAVTLCRVPEMAAGPFVFHDELEAGFAKAAACGYDAVELFFGDPDEVPVETIRGLCERFGLGVAAVGSGAGMVKHGLSLTDPLPEKRRGALDFILRMVEFGGRLGAAHSVEMPFVFDTLGNETGHILGTDPPQSLADLMHGAWVAFAQTGDPGWPAYDLRRRSTMHFDLVPRLVEDPMAVARELWIGKR